MREREAGREKRKRDRCDVPRTPMPALFWESSLVRGRLDRSSFPDLCQEMPHANESLRIGTGVGWVVRFSFRIIKISCNPART